MVHPTPIESQLRILGTGFKNSEISNVRIEDFPIEIVKATKNRGLNRINLCGTKAKKLRFRELQLCIN